MAWPMGTRRNFRKVGGKPKKTPNMKKSLPVRRKNIKKAATSRKKLPIRKKSSKKRPHVAKRAFISNKK